MEPLYLGDRDFELGLTAYSGELYEVGHEMSLDGAGRILTVGGGEGNHLIDVDAKMQSTDGRTWTPIPDGLTFSH